MSFRFCRLVQILHSREMIHQPHRVIPVRMEKRHHGSRRSPKGKRMIRNRRTKRKQQVQTAKRKQIKSPHIRKIRSHRILKRIQQNRRISRRIQIAIKARMAMVKIPLQGQIRQRITIRNRKIRRMVDQTNQIPAKKVRIR